MISLREVTKVWPSGVRAVDGISLEVQRGEIVVLLGSSGCGKTTTLKMINRLIEPSSGEIRVDEHNVAEHDPVLLRRRIRSVNTVLIRMRVVREGGCLATRVEIRWRTVHDEGSLTTFR